MLERELNVLQSVGALFSDENLQVELESTPCFNNSNNNNNINKEEKQQKWMRKKKKALLLSKKDFGYVKERPKWE